MSYPSVAGINARDMVPEEQEDTLWCAFNTDLPLGVKFLTEQAARVKSTGKRDLISEDPNSPLGKQIIRLIGTDIARGIVEKRLGTSFGLYNCCISVCAPDKASLDMTALEQLEFQNGVRGSADC